MLLLSQHWLISDGIPTAYLERSKAFLNYIQYMEELPCPSKKSASLEFITKKCYSQKRIYKTAPQMEKPESQWKECNRWSFQFQWVAAFSVFYISPCKCKIKTGWSYKESNLILLLLHYVSYLLSKIMNV